jgi:hypothetical protein
MVHLIFRLNKNLKQHNTMICKAVSNRSKQKVIFLRHQQLIAYKCGCGAHNAIAKKF